MLTLIAILGNAHAGACADHGYTAVCDGYHCQITNGSFWDGHHLECKLNVGGTGNTNITAVYLGAGEFYIYGYDNNSDHFCCEKENTIIHDGSLAWDGAKSEWYGTDGATKTDWIDLEDWTGDTYVSAGTGNDVIYGVDESGSTDEIHGGDGNEIVDGMAGADFIYGDAGADQICGGAGEDELYGGTGGDILFGGAAYDVMRGGNIGSPWNRCETAAGGANSVKYCNDGPFPYSVPIAACPF